LASFEKDLCLLLALLGFIFKKTLHFFWTTTCTAAR